MSQAIVASIRAKYPTPLGAQHAAFLIETASTLHLGLLKKDTGTNIQLPDGTRVSQDIVMAPDGRIWDILQDGEGAAHPTFNPGESVDPSRFYAVSGAPSQPSQPGQPEQPPVPTDPTFERDVRNELGLHRQMLEQIAKAVVHNPFPVPPPLDIAFPNYEGETVLPLPTFLGGSRPVKVVLKPKENA